MPSDDGNEGECGKGPAGPVVGVDDIPGVEQRQPQLVAVVGSDYETDEDPHLPHRGTSQHASEPVGQDQSERQREVGGVAVKARHCSLERRQSDGGFVGAIAEKGQRHHEGEVADQCPGPDRHCRSPRHNPVSLTTTSLICTWSCTLPLDIMGAAVA